MVLLPDPNHRSWNDVCACLNSCSLWPVVLMSKVLFDTNIGPRDGAKWWEELKEGSDAFVALLARDDPLLARFLPEVLTDLDIDATGMGEKEVFDHISEVIRDKELLSSKGSKISMNRWMNWLEKAEQELRLWPCAQLERLWGGAPGRITAYRVRCFLQ